MVVADTQRLIPDCKVSLDGQRLEGENDTALTRVDVDLDVDLFGQCTLMFNDPKFALMASKDFKAGVAVKVEIGFASKMQTIFEGEIVALEPQFRRDMPASLHVICHETLHRLALASMTRSFQNVDDGEIVKKIAQAHGLQGEGPSGTKEHILQSNVSDATFLRRLAQKHGNHLRVDGKKIIIGPPPAEGEITVGPADGLRKLKVKFKAGPQVSEVVVHGYDPATKKEFKGKAKGEGETGKGAKSYGDEASLVFAGHEHPPADMATAEAMAKGRMRKLAEGFVTAQAEIIGNVDLVPGANIKLDKLGDKINGTYRIEQARHQFAKHGFYTTVTAVKTSKHQPPKPVKEGKATGDKPKDEIKQGKNGKDKNKQDQDKDKKSKGINIANLVLEYFERAGDGDETFDKDVELVHKGKALANLVFGYLDDGDVILHAQGEVDPEFKKKNSLD